MSGQNKTPMDPESRRVRGRQLLLFSGIAAALLIAFAVWFSAGGGERAAATGRDQGGTGRLQIGGGGLVAALRGADRPVGNAPPGDGNQEPALRGGERASSSESLDAGRRGRPDGDRPAGGDDRGDAQVGSKPARPHRPRGSGYPGRCSGVSGVKGKPPRSGREHPCAGRPMAHPSHR